MKKIKFLYLILMILFAVSWKANAREITYKGDVTIYVGENKTFYHSLPSQIYVNSGSWFLNEIEGSNVPEDVQETWCAKIVNSNSQSCTIQALSSNEDMYQYINNYSFELHCKGTGSGNNECYWKITVKRYGYLTVVASPAGGNIVAGQKVTLTAKSNGSTVSDCDIYYTLDGSAPTTSSTKYTSSGVTINNSSWLKAKAFKARYESSDDNEWYYTVQNIPVTSITLKVNTITMNTGDKMELTATVKPDNATNKSVSWSSNKTSVATVDSSLGIVEAIGEGTATITCKANDGSGVTATCTVTVTNPNVIDITSTNFPDENFRNWLLGQEYGKDGKLTEDEIKNVTSIDVYYKNISTLKGIEYFTRLKSLYCQYNQLTSLDVSKNTALEELSCSSNQLTSLDVSNCTALTTLYCDFNQLTSLDVSNCTALTTLDCSSNQLTSLDVSKNTALTTLDCGDNKLTSLDVSNCTALTQLYCYSNQLTSLDVSKNTALTTLDCGDNKLTSLDVSNCTALTQLDCSSNQLTSLDLSKNTALTKLFFHENHLTSLDVSKNTALTILNCHSNQLTSLDVSKNTALTWLWGYSNKLTSLDVSKNTALTTLHCFSNQLTSLDVSNCTALTQLDCQRNQIKGASMDAFIQSLPNMSTNLTFSLINNSEGDEGNVCTKSQVTAAKAKGWTPLYYNGNDWQEYEGSEVSEITIEDFDIKAGEEKELLINLTNPNNEVTRVQFDLHLPEGLTIKKSGDDFDFDMAGRTTWRKHRLDVNEVDGAYRFLLYSSSNTLIEGTSGAIIKMTIVADETFKVGLLVIDNCLLVSPDDSETELEAYEYIIGEATPDDGNTMLSIEPFDIKVGETKEMLIDLTNPDDEVTTLQFDLHLPEGLTIKKSGDELDFDMVGRTTWRKHTLDVNEVGGAYHFHLYSSSNTLIEGTSGPVIKLMVTASQEMNGRKILIDKALLVSPDGKETRPANYLYVIRTFAKGDVNGDGDIGIGDIITITNVMASNETDTDVVRRADVNGDGDIGIGDIISITNIMAGVDTGGGSGGSGAVIDGKTVNTSYAFWCYSKSDKRWFLDFCNADIRSLNAGNFPSSGLNVVSIDFEGDEGSEVPTGEFDDFNVYVVNGMTPNSEGDQMEKPRDKEGKLVITKSGNNYSVSYTGVSLSNDKKTITNTSFSYTGPLTYYDNVK